MSNQIPKGERRSVRKLTCRNAARERTRVQSLRDAFQSLQTSLPAVPPNTKLSKLDVLILASAYIDHLNRLLNHSSAQCHQQHIEMNSGQGILHPVKKWPMRARLYAGLNSIAMGVCPCYCQSASNPPADSH